MREAAAVPGDVLRLYADPQKFLDLCDWKPQVSFQTGLSRTIEYFRNHPLGVDSLLQHEVEENWR